MIIDAEMRAQLLRAGWVPPATAWAVGEAEGAACLVRAEADGDFDGDAAGRFMLEHLGKWGQSSSELLVKFARLHGHAPHDDRAFGPVISGLARRRLIRQVGTYARERGNGTSGGRIWALVTSA